jgi:peptidoglycan/LPS O-acetylase OafA/YrhL
MTRADRIESVTLAAILTVVALSAGWASFTHVHDWTMRHAPTGTPDAFGWVNAVISELVPVAAFLTIQRRRRAGAPIGYPLALLIAAAALSLAAQLAVAQPSPSGWLLSAVPALAFMALVKLIFTGGTGRQDRASTPTVADPVPAPIEPSAAPVPAGAIRSADSVPSGPTTVVPVPAGAFSRKAVA